MRIIFCILVTTFFQISLAEMLFAANPKPVKMLQLYPDFNTGYEEFRFGFPPSRGLNEPRPEPLPYTLNFSKVILSEEEISPSDPRQPLGSHIYAKEFREDWSVEFPGISKKLFLGNLLHRTMIWGSYNYGEPPKNVYWFDKVPCRNYVYLASGVYIICKDENAVDGRLEIYLPKMQHRYTLLVTKLELLESSQFYDYGDPGIGFFYESRGTEFHEPDGYISHANLLNFMRVDRAGQSNIAFSTPELARQCGEDCFKYNENDAGLYFVTLREDAFQDLIEGRSGAAIRPGNRIHLANLAEGKILFTSDIVDPVDNFFFQDNYIYSWGNPKITGTNDSSLSLSQLNRNNGQLNWKADFGRVSAKVEYQSSYTQDPHASFYLSLIEPSLNYDEYDPIGLARVDSHKGQILWRRQQYNFKCTLIAVDFKEEEDNSIKILAHFPRPWREDGYSYPGCTAYPANPMPGTLNKKTGEITLTN